jgi:hypothetical protein
VKKVLQKIKMLKSSNSQTSHTTVSDIFLLLEPDFANKTFAAVALTPKGINWWGGGLAEAS